jgi:hypothetical protein
MKSLHTIIFLMSLLSLISCGVKKTSTTLRISSGMTITNTSYQSGLVFYGRSTTGQFFSAPAQLSATGSNQVDVVLDKGNWTFGAVGWKNPSATYANPQFFQGTPECAVVGGVEVNSDDQTVNLDLDNGNCTDAEFGGNTLGTPVTFQKLQINTCGTFHKKNGTQVTWNDQFCQSSDIHADFKVTAKSARIFVPVLIPGQGFTPASPMHTCVELKDSVPNYYGYSLPLDQFIPAKGMPFAVELFIDDACSSNQLMTSYVFKSGVNNTYPGFDHHFVPQSASPVASSLYLLATSSRRSTSPIISSLPQFSCDASNPDDACLVLPDAAASVNRYVRPNREFYFKDITTNEACSNITLSPTSSDVLLNSNNVGGGNGFKCVERDGKFFISIGSAILTTNSCDAPANCNLLINFQFSGTTYENIAISSLSTPMLEAHELILGALGFQDISLQNALSGTPLNAFNSLLLNEGNEDNSYGVLGLIRAGFAPTVIGGFLSGLSETQLNGISFNVTLWEDGIPKTFQLRSESDSSDIPSYIKGVYTTFDRRLIVSKLNGTPAFPEQYIFKYKSGVKIGQVEAYENKTETGISNISKTLLLWNTESASQFHRFELYSMDKEIDLIPTTPVLKKYRTHFLRAERDGTNTKTSTSGLGARIESYHFDSDRFCDTLDCTTYHYNQRSDKKLALLNGATATYSNEHADLNNQTTPFSFFTNPYTIPFRESPRSSAWGDQAKSPDGNHMIVAWNEYDGTSATFDLKVIINRNGTQVFDVLNTNSNTPIKPVLTISNYGQATLAFTTVTGAAPPDHKLFTLFSVPGTAGWKVRDANDTNSIITAFNSSKYAFKSSMPFSFNLIDQDPTTSSSSKTVIFVDPIPPYLTTAYSVKTLSVSASSGWDPTSTLFVESPYMPENLKIVKHHHTGKFFIAYSYLNSAHFIKFRTTSDLTVGTTTAYGPSSGFNPLTKLDIIATGTSDAPTIDVLADAGGSLRFWQSSTSSPGFSSGSGTTLANLHLNSEAPFTFARYLPSDSSTIMLDDTGIAHTYVEENSLLPTTSLAPAAKSNKFKFDIQSLEPTNFESIFP